MGTGRYYVCQRCGSEQWVPSLFDALRDAAEAKLPACATCEQPRRLRLDFPFGLGAGLQKYHLVAAYFPENPTTWKDEEGKKVEHYPFIVVLEAVSDKSRTAWLPYWHLHYKGSRAHRKYGQWAPHMDMEIFTNLLGKARRDGHI